jgi:hypothetical protein
MVEKEDDVKEAKDKIASFAKEYGWGMTKILSKGIEYLRIFKPEIYEKLM